jgi:hypothetical protein
MQQALPLTLQSPAKLCQPCQVAVICDGEEQVDIFGGLFGRNEGADHGNSPHTAKLADLRNAFKTGRNHFGANGGKSIQVSSSIFLNGHFRGFVFPNFIMWSLENLFCIMVSMGEIQSLFSQHAILLEKNSKNSSDSEKEAK